MQGSYSLAYGLTSLSEKCIWNGNKQKKSALFVEKPFLNYWNIKIWSTDILSFYRAIKIEDKILVVAISILYVAYFSHIYSHFLTLVTKSLILF